MRKFLLSLACLMLLLITPALADTYSFEGIHASLEIPSDYEVVLTPYNLSSNTAWLSDQGMDYDALMNAFEAEGILLQAYDAENDRILVLTALQDLDAQTFFDLNNQDEDMRREYRVSHTNGSAYGVLGYSYSSSKWRNYGGDELRFLQTKYSLRQEGREVCTGYQRRTIRNGYTITLDMQVLNRAAKEADEKALEKIMDTFQFTKILPMPELPIKLALTSAPPSETNSDTFTIKGSSAKNAKVTATVFSLGATGSQTFKDTAGTDGAFSIKVTLPSQGVYSLTLTAEAEGAITAQRMYSVTYQKGMLPVDLTITPSETLTDTTEFAGSTISGAKIQVAVSGPVNTSKTSTKQNFSIEIDTSAEGTYQFVVTVTKKGLDDRIFTFTGVRSYSEIDRVNKIKDQAKKIEYSNLQKSSNEGKTVALTGYITDIVPSTGEWVITFALSKSGEKYKQITYVITETEPQYQEGDKVKVYARAAGSYSVLEADNTLKNYPRLEAYFFESVE